MKNPGFIKVSRKLLDSQVFQNEELLKVWLWCLLRANWKESWVSIVTGRGTSEILVKPGQFLFGRKMAALELRMKPTSVWDRVKKLEKMQNLVIQPDTHYSLISIVNWDGYQARDVISDTQPDNQATGKRQPTDTDKKDKKLNSPSPSGETAMSFKRWKHDDLQKSAQESNTDNLLLESEVEDFVSYWCEPSPSGRPRFTLEKTWDTRRRMKTAFRLIYEKNRKPQSNNLPPEKQRKTCAGCMWLEEHCRDKTAEGVACDSFKHAA